PEARVKSIGPKLFPAAAMFALASAAAAVPPAAKPDVRAEIARRLDVKLEDVRPSPIAGLYEVRSRAEVGYVSEDGRFYVDGDVFDMTSRQNLTEERRRQGRLELLAGVPDGDTIVFAPTGPIRYTLTVFTDIDCAYCRRMHTEIAEFNRLGIRVRYLMFPRNGPDTEAWKKAEAVWCSPDRREALTRAKRGETITAGRCETPVAAHYALGRELGIHGTPGIFTDKGEYLAGYMPAASMAGYLSAPATSLAN
ncbi:MAG: DsbC family protein, partial [Steroidobacteraceae bacterium]